MSLTTFDGQLAPIRASRRRVLAFAGVLAVSVSAGVGYGLYAAGRAEVRSADAAAALSVEPLNALPPRSSDAIGQAMLFRSTALGDSHGRVGFAVLDDRGGRRYVSSLQCDRVHFAGDRGICLQARRGVLTSYHAQLFDRSFSVSHTLPLAGAPSRARMSPDGRLAAMTVFITGHSYMSGNFSTRTSIIDAASGQAVVDDLEKWPVLRDGQPFKATDFNFWGVTFAREGKRFYATLATAGKLFLVEGDVAARQMRIVHDDVECPSLSPDESRIAFKRRVPADASGRLMWRLHVLELMSGTVTPLPAETRSVDDQVEWLGNREVVYALPDDAAGASAAMHGWAMAINGATPPRLVVPLAFSPAVLR